jgi:putative glutathione S-transferase
MEENGRRFVRSETSFRDWISADGSSGFAAEPGRYHLYVAWACPWAHRTAIMRKLKGLEEVIGLSAVGSFMGEDGWAFHDEPGVVPDTVNDASYLREVYAKADPDYTGRVTTPVLWDKEMGTIVNNESREIVRMLPKGPILDFTEAHDRERFSDQIPQENGYTRSA